MLFKIWPFWIERFIRFIFIFGNVCIYCFGRFTYFHFIFWFLSLEWAVGLWLLFSFRKVLVILVMELGFWIELILLDVWFSCWSKHFVLLWQIRLLMWLVLHKVPQTCNTLNILTHENLLFDYLIQWMHFIYFFWQILVLIKGFNWWLLIYLIVIPFVDFIARYNFVLNSLTVLQIRQLILLPIQLIWWWHRNLLQTITI